MEWKFIEYKLPFFTNMYFIPEIINKEDFQIKVSQTSKLIRYKPLLLLLLNQQ